MIQVFRDQHLRKEPRGRNALVDDLRWHRRLDQRLASTTYPLAADVSLDLEHPWDVIELLAHILADALQAAAALALGIFGLVSDLAAREGSGQRHPTGLLFRRRGGLLLQSLDLKADRLDVRIDAFIEKRTLQHTTAASRSRLGS